MTDDPTDHPHYREGLNEHGNPIDTNGIPFNPHAGSSEPVDGRCNALLRNWRDRYGSKRYCTKLPLKKFEDDVDHGFCKTHRQAADLRMQAGELFEHGLEAKTLYHLYDRIDEWKRVFAYATYDQLLDESIFDFNPDYETREFDFSDADDSTPIPPGVDDSGILELEVPYATQYGDAAMALWVAAMMRVQQLNVQEIIVRNDMQSKSVEHADLVAPEGAQPYHMTIEEWSEHHLNLPFDRLLRSRDRLLERGGVGVEDEDDVDESGVTMQFFNDPLDKDGVEPQSLEGDMMDIPVEETS